MTEQEYNGILKALGKIKDVIAEYYSQNYTPDTIPDKLKLSNLGEWTIERFPYSKWKGNNLNLLMWILNETILTKYYRLRTHNDPPQRENTNRTDLIYETNRTIVLTEDIIQQNGYEPGVQPLLPEDASFEDIVWALETISWFV